MYSFYSLETGEFNGVTYDGSKLERNTPAGFGALEGYFNPMSQKVDIATKTVVGHTPPPPSDEMLSRAARSKRDALLASCDWVVTKAVEREQPVPVEWAAYRQALRDVTSQSGFPHTIDWPVPPS